MSTECCPTPVCHFPPKRHLRSTG